ncbi:MAG TPA: tol-pal system-associated acyl-CoA thioesterase [Rudaea sp.]|nr:tol-pal system-associated acyl-CoA thioesterase [Rudaea sp.]
MSAHPVFSWPVRVYWEDTDAGGVVYHAAYLRFLERARSEWLRACGVAQQRLREEHGVLFVVADMQVKFLAPARLDDVLHADITAFTRRSASMRFAQCILRPADGVLLIEADVRAACIDATSYKPRRIPDSLLSEFLPA